MLGTTAHADGCSDRIEVFHADQWVCDAVLPGGWGVYTQGGGWYYVGEYGGGCTVVLIQRYCEVTNNINDS